MSTSAPPLCAQQNRTIGLKADFVCVFVYMHVCVSTLLTSLVTHHLYVMWLMAAPLTLPCGEDHAGSRDFLALALQSNKRALLHAYAMLCIRWTKFLTRLQVPTIIYGLLSILSPGLNFNKL